MDSNVRHSFRRGSEIWPSSSSYGTIKCICNMNDNNRRHQRTWRAGLDTVLSLEPEIISGSSKRSSKIHAA